MNNAAVVILNESVFDEPALVRLARALALKLRAGDTVALWGDLGAGKSTFARAFIRASLGNELAEVPSPTFALEQAYATQRFTIAHYDLYRLKDAPELSEIGWDDRIGQDIVLVEWPDRAQSDLPSARIDLALTPGSCDDTRAVSLTASSEVALRVRRAVEIADFVGTAAAWRTANIVYLQGDASARAYARLTRHDGETAILMDAPRQPDGPPVRDGQPYSRLAHLAEDVSSFVAVGARLESVGLNVPHVLARDEAKGLLLLSDLGDGQFGAMLDQGCDQATLWLAAIDVLIHLRRSNPSTDLADGDAAPRPLPRLDRAALEIETELLLDWYWPHHVGTPLSTDARASFQAHWRVVFDRMLARPPGWFLRDYHSPNLLWQPAATGIGRVGVIDFQDALAEPWAYDVASLLQDARRDVPADLEQRLLAHYCAEVRAFAPTFDERDFRLAYADFGAQRNTRLIGLWVRLLKRDGKPQYLQHMARTWGYLARNLAHPDLAPLKTWFDQHVPEAVRKRPVKT